MARVLVLDDEEQMLKALQRILGKQHEVFATASATDALRALDEQTFDVLLVDAFMPRMNGEEFIARAVAAHPSLQGRIVVMSGAEEGVPAGLPLLAKPFGAEAVEAAIDAIATRP